MTDVAVLVPLRIGDCRHRQAAWDYVHNWWATNHPGWPLVTGSCGDGPWSKGAAVADALTKTGAQILILADADLWCDGIDEAVKRVDTGEHPWAIPHRLVHRLTEAATERVLAGEPASGPLDQPPYVGIPGGGITVIHRELYRRAPIDPRFEGWGHEDSAAALAWTRLGGRPWRGTADLWHLWHPPQPRQSRSIGSDESMELLRRYQAAQRNQDWMRALLAEIGADASSLPFHALREDRPVKFISEKYPDLHIPTIGVRFRNGEADVTTRGAIAYLRSPWMRKRGVLLASEVERPEAPPPSTVASPAPDVQQSAESPPTTEPAPPPAEPGAPVAGAETGSPDPDTPTETGGITPVGGGWYEVTTMGGEVVAKVRGKEAAQERYDTLAASVK